MHLQNRRVEENETANVLREVKLDAVALCSSVERFGIDVLDVAALPCVQGTGALWQITRKGGRPETGLGQTLFELVAGCRLDLACDVINCPNPCRCRTQRMR